MCISNQHSAERRSEEVAFLRRRLQQNIKHQFIHPDINIFLCHLPTGGIRRGINQCFISDVDEWNNRY